MCCHCSSVSQTVLPKPLSCLFLVSMCSFSAVGGFSFLSNVGSVCASYFHFLSYHCNSHSASYIRSFEVILSDSFSISSLERELLFLLASPSIVLPKKPRVRLIGSKWPQFWVQIKMMYLSKQSRTAPQKEAQILI